MKHSENAVPAIYARDRESTADLFKTYQIKLIWWVFQAHSSSSELVDGMLPPLLWTDFRMLQSRRDAKTMMSLVAQQMHMAVNVEAMEGVPQPVQRKFHIAPLPIADSRSHKSTMEAFSAYRDRQEGTKPARGAAQVADRTPPKREVREAGYEDDGVGRRRSFLLHSAVRTQGRPP